MANELPHASHTSAPDPQPAPPHGARRRTWRRFFMLNGLAVLCFLVVAAVGLAGTEYYCSRASFCGTCHIMGPYYDSWAKDIHGAKLGALCIDCHYAPGERFTIKAKFKGLSQVASYFSGRYGTSRPRAHVSDDSCLRSGCHNDQAYLNKMLPIGEPRVEKRIVGGLETEVTRAPTVNFFHSKHLDASAKLAEAIAQRDALAARVRAAAAPDVATQLAVATISVAPAEVRNAQLGGLLKRIDADPSLAQDAFDLMEAEHRVTRLRQLDGLNCTACHMFDPSGNAHIAIDRTACYTCHFANESFNRGTAECLKCHQAPTRSVLVHSRPAAGVGDAVLMDHQDIVKRNVDCESCHADVVRGDTSVSIRDCTHCHDQARFTQDFETRTTQTVEEYHRVHVHGQRARCVDCHRAIQHGLVEAEQVASSSGFLEPVLNDCRHCHPNHHSEQVGMLMGTGGRGITATTPNAMIGSRLNCRACHTKPAIDEKGDEVIRATQQGCIACHSEDYLKLIDQWRSEIDTYLQEMETQLVAATAAFERTVARDPATADEARPLLDQARENIRFVRVGGGLHNRHYALQLLDNARQSLERVNTILGAGGGGR